MSEVVTSLRDRLTRLNEGAAEETEQALPVSIAPTISVTAGELRAACKANSSHVNASTFKKSVSSFPDNYKVVVERADLEALLDDKEIETETITYNGQKVTRKKVIPKARTSPQKTPAPASKKDDK